jgi:hypothetical protein
MISKINCESSGIFVAHFIPSDNDFKHGNLKFIIILIINKFSFRTPGVM